ncbi:lysophosphatidic acid receptor 6-like [Hemicordylus capensis]|uniref:lysophosphatidic acid receptor 6-like n=1 Tax=Hemicordylus capensis TaxID=884348 RepID=UPI002303EA06|nr:lysophosphatidic acid receptor 6-like [Hemicordylus capensis]
MSPLCTNCSSSSSSSSSGADLAFASMYSALFLVGLPLNVAALCIFFSGGAGRSATILYMKNLAACDLLLLASLPLRAYYYSRRPPLPDKVCEVTGLLLLVNMYGSIFLLTCISWDRCLAICFPLSRRAQALRQHAKLICVGAWALSVAGTIPSYFVVRGKGLGANSTRGGASGGRRCFDSRPLYITAPGVSSAMVLCFALPLAIMVICSCSLLRAVHRSTAAHMELVSGAKIRQMVVTNIAIFLLCFLPYHVAVLCYQVQALKEGLALVYQSALLLACANAALDPLAYYFTTETFRHLVTREHFLRGWGSHSHAAGGAELLSLPMEAPLQAPALPTAAFHPETPSWDRARESPPSKQS